METGKAQDVRQKDLEHMYYIDRSKSRIRLATAANAHLLISMLVAGKTPLVSN